MIKKNRLIALLAFGGGALGLLNCSSYKPPAYANIDNKNRASVLEKKIETDPGDVESRMELSRIYMEEDLYRLAVPELEKVVELDPARIEAYLLLSLALQRGPDPDLDKVESILESALVLAPDNADVHLHLAQVSVSLAKEDRAEAEFIRALELSRDAATLVSTHLGLMSIYQKRGEAEKAQWEYEQAKMICPQLDGLLKQAEINLITPAPDYGGGDSFQVGGSHPPFEKRILELQKLIHEQNGEETDEKK